MRVVSLILGFSIILTLCSACTVSKPTCSCTGPTQLATLRVENDHHDIPANKRKFIFSVVGKFNPEDARLRFGLDEDDFATGRIIAEIASQGWSLVAVSHVPDDSSKNNRAVPTVWYYFKK